MMDFSAVQIAMVLVIALLVFGPHKLPEIGRQVGRGLREARRQVSEVGDRFTGDLTDEPDHGSPASRTAAATSDTPATTDAARTDDDADLLDGVVITTPSDDPHAGAADDDADLLGGVMTTTSGGVDPADAVVSVGDGAPGHPLP